MIRHGPVPPGRVMFQVKAEDTIAHAAKAGLEVRLHRHGESRQACNREAGVTWTTLAFALGSARTDPQEP